MGSDARHLAVCGSAVGLLLVVAAAPSPAEPRAARPCPKPEPDVTLVWYDVFDVFRDNVAGSSREVQEVFCRIGVDVAWRVSEPGGSFASDDGREIAVTVLRRYHRAREGEPVMGVVSSRVEPGVPRPVHVYLEGVAAALGNGRAGASRPPARLLVRAVGRVVAHELIHVLAPWEQHAEEGLMSSSLGRDALLGAPPELGELHARAVRIALDDDPPAQPTRLAAAPSTDEVLTAPVPAVGTSF